MESRKEDIVLLTSSEIPISFSHWSEILKYFTQYKTQLDVADLQLIVDRSEECRLYLNIHSSSHIEKNEVVPNVYEYLKELQPIKK